jgi:gas vesicle protein GvpG
MFILDSLMISGIRWALETAVTAAEAEMNDDSVLREQLLETEMRREMGEISDEEFQEIEADLLARIREIKERRTGGSGPIEFGAQPLEASGENTFKVEASVSGDFHESAAAPHTTVIETDPVRASYGGLVNARGWEQTAVLDMEPGDAAPPAPASPEPATHGRPAARTRPRPKQRPKTTARRTSARADGSSRGTRRGAGTSARSSASRRKPPKRS